MSIDMRGIVRAWHPWCVVNAELEWPADQQWYTLDEVAGLLGISMNRVRRLMEDRSLAAVSVDGRPRVPVEFLDGAEPRSEIRGTLIVLSDAGYTTEQAVHWLLTDTTALGDRPIAALLAGRKAEVRRVAQALSF